MLGAHNQDVVDRLLRLRLSPLMLFLVDYCRGDLRNTRNDYSDMGTVKALDLGNILVNLNGEGDSMNFWG